MVRTGCLLPHRAHHIVLTPLTTLDAYRADLDRHPDRNRVAEFDGVWIIIARTVEQFLELDRQARVELSRSLGRRLLPAIEAATAWPPQHREPLASLARTLRDDGLAGRGEQLFDGVIRVAEDMEGAGALHLAFTMLGCLRAGFPDVDSRRHGLALALQGRIAREMGDLESATELYTEAYARAASQRDYQTIALLAHGLGGLALARGNLPEARAEYERALRHARAADAPDLEGRAHRGLLVVCAKAKDFDAALRHGWAAYVNSGDDRNSQAELLANVASLCRDCGYYSASFAGYCVAVLWSDMYRIRIPALAGAALASALERRSEYVSVLTARIESELAERAHPFDSALSLLDLAYAHEAIGDPGASALASRVHTIATAHGFFELEHHAGELLNRTRSRTRPALRAPLALSTSAEDVLNAMTALARETSAISALVGSTG